MIMKRGVFDGTCDGRTGGGFEWIEVNLDCLLCGGSHACSSLCVSGPILRRQSCSASKLVCKGKYLEAAELLLWLVQGFLIGPWLTQPLYCEVARTPSLVSG